MQGDTGRIRSGSVSWMTVLYQRSTSNVARPALLDRVDAHAAFLEDPDEILLELLFVHGVCGALEVSDIDIADVVFLDDVAGSLPVGGAVELGDVVLAAALRRRGAAPLVLMPGPAQDGRQARVLGDARVASIAAPNRFGDHTIRRGSQPEDGRGLIRVVALNARDTVEGAAT